MNDETEDRLMKIEIRVAEQEQSIAELNDVVTDQQSRIMQLEQLTKSLIDKLNDLADGGSSAAPAAETPPHY